MYGRFCSMKWEVGFRIKDSIRNWSDQIIDTNYNGVAAHIWIKDLECKIELDGKENVEETFYLLWELLFLYDGYFYEPVYYIIDGKDADVKLLIRTKFYSTDETWYSSALLGRNERNLSPEIIEKYAIFRSLGMADKKMTKSIVNAFYYMHSNAYKDINSNHRLSLLLNIADGFIINMYKDTKDVKQNLDKLFKKTVNPEKVKRGVELLGLPKDNYRYNLVQERHSFDHYVYLEDSIAAFVFKSTERKREFMTWYFIYVLELVIRINFLKKSGVEVKEEITDYAMDSIVDWIIYENDLEEECSTPGYQWKQLERKFGRNNKEI